MDGAVAAPLGGARCRGAPGNSASHCWAVAQASDESPPMDRYTDEMLGLLEVCSDKLLHAAAWIFHRGLFRRSCRGCRRIWSESIACARAAYDEPGLGPEFGLLADCDFVLGTPLRSYATA